MRPPISPFAKSPREMSGGRYPWRLANAAPAEAGRLAQSLNLPPLVAGLLWNRGFSETETARNFLDASIEGLHDPFLMAGMRRAVERAARAVLGGERIIVYGDYDVDGVCATALMVWFFRSLGREVERHIPDRLTEGYGLNREVIQSLIRKGNQLQPLTGSPGLLITVDCGITNIAEVKAAVEAGFDVIVTDHHQPIEELPPAHAVVDPHQPDCEYPDKSLCGTAIGFKFLMGLRRALRDAGWTGDVPNLRRSLDLVALATVADVVDIQGENRILLRHGLQELAASSRPGLRSLIRMAGISPETRSGAMSLSYGQVAFQLGPRINAAGRLGQADQALAILLENDPAQATRLAAELDRLNGERQDVQDRVHGEVRKRLLRDGVETDRPIVMGGDGWHPGVLGIVASKLTEEFCLPVILIGLAGEEGVGSGRSIGDFHLHQALAECSDLLEKFGGHEFAAGLTIKRDRLDDFIERLSQVSRERMAGPAPVPALTVEARLELSDFTFDTLEALERMSPFGPGNVRPLFWSEGLKVIGGIRTVGKEGRHLKLELHDPNSGHSAKAIGFGMGNEERLEFLSRPDVSVDVVFEAGINRWNGLENLQLHLKDLRPSDHP